MAIKIITYDLNKDAPREQYQKLYDFLDAHNAVRLSESTYALETEGMTNSFIYDGLYPALDSNDFLLVLAMEDVFPSGQHHDDVLNWLFARTSKIDGNAIATLFKPVSRPTVSAV